MADTTEGSREGTQFGPYRLRRLVGRGGMGDVYEAEDTVRERVVALKLMSQSLSQDPVFRTRMQREARTAGRLQEPHVVPIHDYGEIDGQLYVDMRLIDGKDLAAILKRFGPLTPPRAVAIIRQIGSALDAAHAAGVTHRDVKPENILVSSDDFAYLVDFGIASAGTDEKLTQLGSTVGTLYYMAPERFGETEVTYRADIYALACVLYECLAGSPPFRGDQLSVMGSHINKPVPRPSLARSGIPAAFDAVIARGMAKDPADRYPTCSDLSAAAYAALASPDQDRASDILSRSQVAQVPPQFAGQTPSGYAPVPPPAHAMPHGGSAPVPWPSGPGSVPGSAPMPTPMPTPMSASGPPPQWAGTHGWGAAPPGSTGVPQWGQQPNRPSGLLRKPWLWVGLAIAVIVAVAGGLIIGLSGSKRSAAPPKTSTPQPAADAVALNVLNDGVFIGSSAAIATIDVFNEPICPPCGAFIRSYASDIETAVENKKLAVRYHLLTFLDEQSHTKNYSTRAVAASYCVATQNDPKIYMSFYAALFGSDFQPQEGALSDRTDAELAHLAQTVGANTTATNCIKSGADLGTAQTKATNASTSLAGFNANGTPFVWDGSSGVDLQNPNWLTKLIG
ncbi:serine/threonine protein kinase [Mycobacterium asiaticum]|uniref:non-specific serine/threonine protein kinase n=1 Tax=Mycobacterium asiaticum TaxID=1790 RepID=A0A1A3PE71_MYCAS|nr:serine/threonine protein kinase PknE [Mycobacterium asiaticum]OBK31599.1 serine/threonine protein kinase [Mycobacterium asiaticum]